MVPNFLSFCYPNYKSKGNAGCICLDLQSLSFPKKSDKNIIIIILLSHPINNHPPLSFVRNPWVTFRFSFFFSSILVFFILYKWRSYCFLYFISLVLLWEHNGVEYWQTFFWLIFYVYLVKFVETYNEFNNDII